MQSTALASARVLTTLSRTKGLTSSVAFTTQSMEDGRGSWMVPAFTAGRRLKASEQLAIIHAKVELENLVVTADVADEASFEDAPADDETQDEVPF
jgi:hypothetical protein